MYIWREGSVLITGVFLSHRGNIIPNHGYVMISGIGSTSVTALTCHTNRPATLNNNTNSGGEWFAPNGTQVIGDEVPGFRSNRIPKIVRLLRNTGSPSEGIYHCLIENAAMTEQTVYVGLYNSRRGMSIHIFSQNEYAYSTIFSFRIYHNI